MNYLAIDTSSARLMLAAEKKGERAVTDLPDCAMQHSVRLMEETDALFRRLALSPSECDFFACNVGPGSFTGIRIGISTVKGFCLALRKPALAFTSFDLVAYAERSGKKLALTDAGHGHFYACGFTGTEVTLPPCFLSGEEVLRLREEGYTLCSTEELSLPTVLLSPMEGMIAAVHALASHAGSAENLEAVYLRKSSAEEGR